MEGLEKDVHIYYLCETGSEDTIITKLLDHYAAESGHLSWEQKDPTLYPTFAAKYGAENVSTGSLIVTCGENSTVLDAADLYEYDYTDYYTTGSASVTFGGEKQITSAIYKLTAAGQSHAYYTTNHGEQTLTDSLTDALDAQNIDAQPLDLLTSTIPEDCDLLIINAPTTDFTAGDGLVDEISQLQDYLAAGGKLLLTSSVYAQTPQLDAVLAQFGLARAEGMVVEGDSGKALYNSAWSLLPDYGTPTESTALNGVNTNTHVMLSVAQGITVTETEDVTAEPLLNSSSSAYANILAVKEGNENEPLVKALIAALSSKQVADYITEKYDGSVVSVVENPGDGYDADLDYTALAGLTISVAASPAPHAEILAVAKEILAAKDITLDIQEYSDYVIPNNVVEDGTVLANYFQHTPYLCLLYTSPSPRD